MSGNNGEGNIATRDLWQTPQELFNMLHSQYNIEFDCCAISSNTKCKLFSSSFEEILKVENVAWMNPPFSLAWKMFEHFFKVVEKGIAIYRCDNFETGIWQKVIFPNASWIFIPDKRINYEGLDGNSARFPSALIGVGVLYPTNIIGTLLKKG